MDLKSSLHRFLLCSLLCFGGLFGVTSITLGQDQSEQNESTKPALHGQWAVGLQVGPVVGPSVRYAATERVSVQIAGLPATFREKGFQGVVGARVRYKIIDQSSYNTFASVGVSTIFDRQARGQIGGGTAYTLQTLPLVAGTVGAEGALGVRFGISGEIGAGWFADGEIASTLLVAGVGLHYYW